MCVVWDDPSVMVKQAQMTKKTTYLKSLSLMGILNATNHPVGVRNFFVVVGDEISRTRVVVFESATPIFHQEEELYYEKGLCTTK